MDATEYTNYQYLVDCLQYLTHTYSNIVYVVHHVAQIVSSPYTCYLLVIKRILLYLMGILDFNIIYHPIVGTVISACLFGILTRRVTQTLSIIGQGLVCFLVPTSSLGPLR